MTKSSGGGTKKKGKKVQKKEEIAEDWCFVCKDGGLLLVCDYKQCLKAYHAECVEKDESFIETGNSWTCNWHSCLICHKSSKFQCFCCPNAVCQRCVTAAEFARVRGNKGFCNNCLKLAMLGEENMDVDSDGERVDFKDRETYEGLFLEYWDIIKEKEGLTLEHLHFADSQMKKGENIKSSSFQVAPDKDEGNDSISDYEDEDEDSTEEHMTVQKRKRVKGRQFMAKREVKSSKREFIGWGSKSLVDFLASIGKDTSNRISQYDVSSIINAYINENKLFDPNKKRKIICDERLKSVFGRKTLNRHKIYDLLEPHYLENLEPLEEDELGYSSEDKDENVLVTCRKARTGSTYKKSHEKEMVVDSPRSCFASIVAENVKLVYLRRSLVQELLKQPETFESKVTGTFVRVKLDSSHYVQRNSHQLVQVTGTAETSLDGNNREILLQVSNMSKDISVSMLSDDNFSEEECEDLRQKVKDGLLRKLTIVELEGKARCLHEDITKHWIARELALLQNLIDRANEKGWRRELFEYLERRKLLQTPAEQLRLLQQVPKVIADESDVELMFKNAIKEYKQQDEKSAKSICMETSATPGDNFGARGISSVDGAVTTEKSIGNIGLSLANDGKGNAHGTQRKNAGSSIQAAKGKEHHVCGSTPEVEEIPIAETLILEELPQESPISQEMQRNSTLIGVEQLPEQSHSSEDQCNVTRQSEPHQSSPPVAKKDLKKDTVKKMTRTEEASEVEFIDLNDDDDDIKDQDSAIWYCVGPNGERKGPHSLSMLKRWSETTPFASSFKVWKTGQSEENSIPMSKVISQISPSKN